MSPPQLTRPQKYQLAISCLVVGITLGWVLACLFARPPAPVFPAAPQVTHEASPRTQPPASTPETVTEAPTGAAPKYEALASWVCDTYLARNCDPELPLVVEKVARAAKERNIPEEIAIGVVLKESRFDAGAVNAKSGDYGLMQVNYRWHRDKVPARSALLDIDTNIRIGMNILQEYAKREKQDWARALRRYNGLNGKNNYPGEVLAKAARLRMVLAAHAPPSERES